MKQVLVVIGAGQVGQAIARRVGVGKQVLLADVRRRWDHRGARVNTISPGIIITSLTCPESKATAS
jgi:lactate dehydrogenase-like 2-hydroxyacid dehydrogenase